MTPRLAFIGCGSHATNNLYPALKYADCVLDSVCDLDPGLASRNARLFGAEASYTEAERLLDERQVDGVLVVGPPAMHYQIGKLVLARGLPVYVEKPTAPSLAQATELVAWARRHRTFVMTGYMKRFGTAYQQVRSLIRERGFIPALGSLRYGHWHGEDLDGMLHTMSVHVIDLAIALLGPVREVTSHSMRLPNRGISVALTLRFQRGALAQLALSSAMPRIQERLELAGSLDQGNALVVVDNVQHLELHRQGENGIDLLASRLCEIKPVMSLQDIQVWRPDFAIPNMGQTRLFFQGFAGAIREFVSAISERRDPSPSPEEALEAMRVVAAVLARPDGATDLGAVPPAWSLSAQASRSELPSA